MSPGSKPRLPPPPPPSKRHRQPSSSLSALSLSSSSPSAAAQSASSSSSLPSILHTDSSSSSGTAVSISSLSDPSQKELSLRRSVSDSRLQLTRKRKASTIVATPLIDSHPTRSSKRLRNSTKEDGKTSSPKKRLAEDPADEDGGKKFRKPQLDRSVSLPEPSGRPRRKAAIAASQSIELLAKASSTRSLRPPPSPKAPQQAQHPQQKSSPALPARVTRSASRSSMAKGKGKEKAGPKDDEAVSSSTQPRKSSSRSKAGSKDKDKSAPVAIGMADNRHSKKQSYDADDHSNSETEEKESKGMESVSHPQSGSFYESIFTRGAVRHSGSGNSHLANLLSQLKSPNQTSQLVALQELAEILSVATEDMFMGHGSSRLHGFDAEEFIKALVDILQGGAGGFAGGGDPELQFLDEDIDSFGFGGNALSSDLMLLACRCLANLFEAHPTCIPYAASCGGVQVLVSKLTEIEYIDLAEQVLSVLDKIAVENSVSVLKANGVVAVLQFIDFFSLHVQRIAVNIAANSCKGLHSSALTNPTSPVDVLSMLKEVLPILERLVQYPDSKIVESSVRCLERIVDWAGKNESHLSKLVSTALINSLISLLNSSVESYSSNSSLAGTSNPLFSPIMKILSTTTKCLPTLGAELMAQRTVINLISGYLTGGYYGASSDDPQALTTAVMTVIVGKPSSELISVLHLANDLLPPLPKSGIWDMKLEKAMKPERSGSPPKKKGDSAGRSPSPDKNKEEKYGKLLKILRDQPEALKSHVSVILPLLVEVLSATVNPTVRRLCVECLAKSLWFSLEVASDNSEWDTTLRGERGEIMAVLRSALTQSRGFGKCISEILSLQEIAFTAASAEPTPGADSKGPTIVLHAERDRREALVLVAAGLQIVSIIVDRCAHHLKIWLSREGVFSEISKVREQCQSYTESLKVGLLNSSKPPLAPETKSTGVKSATKPDQQKRDEEESSRKSDPEDNVSTQPQPSDGSDQDSDSGASLQSSTAGPNGSGPAESTPSSLFSNVRKALDRITRGALDLTGLPSPAGLPADSAHIVGLNGSRFSQTEICNWVVKTCDDIVGNLSSSSEDWSTNVVLRELRSLTTSLKAIDAARTSESVTTYLLSLQEVAEHFAGLRGEDWGLGVTGFEILESGIMEGLIDYLVLPGASEHFVHRKSSSQQSHPIPHGSRVKSFLHVFLNGPSPDGKDYFVPGAFKTLVGRLQECLSRTESFRVLLAIPSSSSLTATSSILSFFGSFFSSGSEHLQGSFRDLTNPSLQLTRQIKLRLVSEDQESVPQAFRHLIISIHAIATFQTLEDYLKGRVGPYSEANSGESSADDHASSEGEVSSEDASGEQAANETEQDNTNSVEQEDDEDEDDDPEEHEGEEDYDDENSDENEEIVDIGDLLLMQEQRQRAKKSWNPEPKTDDLSSSPARGKSRPLSAKKGRPDSVVDVFASSTPASPSPLSAALAAGKSPTHLQDQSSSHGKEAKHAGSSSPLSKPSYALAVSASQDAFDLAFYLGDKEIPLSSTIFGFFFDYEREQQEELAARSGTRGQSSPDIWSKVYTIKFKKVKSPKTKKVEQPAEEVGSGGGRTNEDPMDVDAPTNSVPLEEPFQTASPAWLKDEPSCSMILVLLRLLFSLNSRWDEFLRQDNLSAPVVHPIEVLEGAAIAADGAPEAAASKPEHRLSLLPAAAFNNSKLTAKLNRQLIEPLIVVSDVLPSWCSSIVREFPFLVPFETRLAYLQSTSFGFARSIMRWQQASGSTAGSGQTLGRNSRGSVSDIPTIGRLQKQKVRIARTRIIDSMMKIMDLYGSSQLLLEVEFFDEVGTGLGPTLEFYSLVSKELRRREGVEVGKSRRKGAGPSALSDGLRASSGPSPTDKLKIWRDDGQSVLSAEGDVAEYFNPASGLFPRPIAQEYFDTDAGRKLLQLFKAIGTFVARSLQESRLIDIPFSPVFLEMAIGLEGSSRRFLRLGGESPEKLSMEMHTLQQVDPILHSSLVALTKYLDLKREIEDDPQLKEAERRLKLEQVTVKGAKIEDLCLDFTLPGYPEVELVPNGQDVPITLANVREYLEKVVVVTVRDGIQKQVEAFREGFEIVFPLSDLQIFSVSELAVLLGGNDNEDWSTETLMDAMKADHGYSMDSKVIQYLAELLSSLNAVQRREFLMFVTGAPKLPLGGFKALNPPLTVVRKQVDAPGRKPDDYLPSVMTCVNYLKVPQYSSLAVMRERFEVAIKEGQGCFHLS